MKIRVKLYAYGELLTSYDVTAYKTMRGFRLHGLKKEVNNLSRYGSSADKLEVWYNGQLWMTFVYSGLNGWVDTREKYSF